MFRYSVSYSITWGSAPSWTILLDIYYWHCSNQSRIMGRKGQIISRTQRNSVEIVEILVAYEGVTGRTNFNHRINTIEFEVKQGQMYMKTALNFCLK